MDIGLLQPILGILEVVRQLMQPVLQQGGFGDLAGGLSLLDTPRQPVGDPD
ncbi:MULTISPECIES: hypothetical protein [unclassified Mesorhizobium]|uniref:hypothetical protein n=1 Tax=unclassified Mesorhizobium TaxID=325217 RepID=UPI001FE0D4AD|nr:MULTISPECIES: hypothetical protein [unclassified Mesorhizobium]